MDGSFSLDSTSGELFLSNDSGGSDIKFDGFAKEDKTDLSGFLSEKFGVVLEDRKLALKGINFGDPELSGGFMLTHP